MNDEVTYYKYGGDTTIDEDDMCCAKMIKPEVKVALNLERTKMLDGDLRYFIKFSRNSIFNPLDLDARLHSKAVNKGEYKWVKVRKDCFDLYLSFLQSGKNMFLRQCERQII